MNQEMGYENYNYDNEGETYREGQKWPSLTNQYAATDRDKIFEPGTKRGLSIVAIGVSFIVWCLFAFMIFIAYGGLNVSPSPSAHASQIFLIVGLVLFSFFVIWANILLIKLRNYSARNRKF